MSKSSLPGFAVVRCPRRLRKVENSDLYGSAATREEKKRWSTLDEVQVHKCKEPSPFIKIMGPTYYSSAKLPRFWDWDWEAARQFARARNVRKPLLRLRAWNGMWYVRGCGL
ncbi:hypothetical protein ACLOJK_013266 [Asimina triloba]